MRFARLLVVAAVLAPVGACTEAQEPQVPTAQQTAQATSAPSPAPVQESNYDKALRFTRCMNDTLDEKFPGATGRVRRLPDPVEGQPLGTDVFVPPDVYQGPGLRARFSKEDTQWQVSVPEIFERCKHHLPAVWPVKADPDDQARFGRFYDCLRERGIDVPKPDANGYIHTNPNQERTETPEYQAAEAACRPLTDDPATKVDS